MIGAALSVLVLLVGIGLLVAVANPDRVRAGWRDLMRDSR